jgi:Alkaline phosphatase PhoX
MTYGGREMRKRTKGVALLGAVAAGASAIALMVGNAGASSSLSLTDVPTANPKVAGFTEPDKLSPELTKSIVAQGNMALENPAGANGYYGYDTPGPFVPLPGTTFEAQKTEPDKNTYLVMRGLHGADPRYFYGTHFLFQGHETGAPGYITRVNLDADVDHRVTLLANADVNGTPLPVFDGSTWDPFAHKLLFTAELGANGGVWQATPDINSKVQDISGILGRAGYEGIQNDGLGNLFIVEDTGGATASDNSRVPNSFVYRFVPKDRTDLTRGGKLQVLQLKDLQGGPFDASTFSSDMKDLHTYGNVFQTKWVTIHDTAVNGTTPFDANAAAKAAGATPFKRPENGMFRPGSAFRQFVFDETGDTNASSPANDDFGGWGSLFSYKTDSAASDHGTLTILFKGNEEHAGFDNMTFLTRDDLAVVEDAGDGLHASRNALDSGYVFDVTHNYADGSQPIRFLAQGRDASATIDSALGSLIPKPADFHNEGDNEITGIHTSDGDPTVFGILGTKVPAAFSSFGGWRTFFTGQHGDNITWEITRQR